jgi:hypothetical protein
MQRHEQNRCRQCAGCMNSPKKLSDASGDGSQVEPDVPRSAPHAHKKAGLAVEPGWSL